MRARIRLTGRKPLPRSSISVRATQNHDEVSIALSIVKSHYFESFPLKAEIKLRLYENKLTETLNFGKLGALFIERKIQNQTAFSAPTCQLRIVQSSGERKGVLLGSTSTWTLPVREEDPGPDKRRCKGILMVQLFDIAPRAWKLDIREDAHPVLYLDSSIPDARAWARTDPTFISSVFPAVIREIFDNILVEGDSPDIEWVADWLKWAGTLMPDQVTPFEEHRQRQQEWIDNLLDRFCQQNRVLDLLCGHLYQGAAHA